MASKLLLITFVICRLLSTVGFTMDPLARVTGQLSSDPDDLEAASRDFGGMSRAKPLAVLHPASAEDVASVVRAGSAQGFTVSARGHGHSINGQAQVGRNGVVIDMSGPKGRRFREEFTKPVLGEVVSRGGDSRSRSYYVDVWGGELWIDVLKWSLDEHGLAPKSWTDYLYLSVGGTLSNAGISGQAFHQGPQTSNVYELDVVTGTLRKGELMTCSEEKNSELFHGVLGGLGQFGIITRARIALETAPQRVKWVRVLYSNFSAFTKDQEYLISLHGGGSSERFDYVEGFIIVDEGLINNWRSSFFSPRNPVNLTSIGAYDVLYCLEVTKNYDKSTADTVDQVVETLLKKLDFIPSSVFTTDVTYLDFLDRVHKAELKLRAKNLWHVPHPWLNLFVPKSQISKFNDGVFKGMLAGNKTSGPILIYPMNRNKWDQRSSVVTPDEDVFYLVALLRSATEEGPHTLDNLRDQNRRILHFCEESGIKVKRYLPDHSTLDEWKGHFGEKWEAFKQMKMKFDPSHILAVGQRIFQPSFTSHGIFDL
ncbi:hypothetical protein Syun_005154 [Stephania yunnanensis]|uniref:cytokinin dehydrogenase n=1 Tax=Stephania yunnanensis TaxID=152371 RepID=A0AAP0L5R4_9MAGN